MSRFAPIVTARAGLLLLAGVGHAICFPSVQMGTTAVTRSSREAAGQPLLLGETVHYRAAGRCWAAAIVELGSDESAQLYLFPLPPAYPMPQAPGTFIAHDGATREASWHRFPECGDAPAPKSSRRARSRQPKRRSSAADAS